MKCAKQGGATWRDGKRKREKNKLCKLKPIPPVQRVLASCHIKRDTHFGVALISLPAPPTDPSRPLAPRACRRYY